MKAATGWLLLPAVIVPARATTLMLGFLYPYLGPMLSSPRYGWVVDSVSQFKLAVQDVNNDTTLLPNKSFILNYSIYNSEGVELAAVRGAKALTDIGVIGIVGCAFSREFQGPAFYVSSIKSVMMSPGTSAVNMVDKARYPYTFRSIGSDASLFQGMVNFAVVAGWQRLAALIRVDLVDGANTVLQPLYDAAGLQVLTLTWPNPTTYDLQVRLNSALQLAATTGFRVLLAYPLTAAQNALVASINAQQMCGPKYVWLAWAYTAVGPWQTCMQSLAFVVDSTPQNALQAGYAARWARVSRRWNASVDGWLNPTTFAPFFNDPYSPIIWDTADGAAGVGDGIPDQWGTFVYDSVWLFATAANSLINKGLDPYNGDAMQQELRRTTFNGVSGLATFNQITQDRVLALQVQLVTGTSSRVIVATSNATCSQNCLTFRSPYQSAADLPWQAGRLPTDGQMLDASKSSFATMPTYKEDTDLTIGISVRDSFGAPPCGTRCLNTTSAPCLACLRVQVNYSALTVVVIDSSTGQPLQPKSAPQVGSVNIALGQAQVVLSGGVAGSGAYDRTVLIKVTYLGDLLGNMTTTVVLASTACQAGEARDPQSGGCIACSPGSYTAVRGASACVKCPAGSEQPNARATGCTLCSPGKFTAGQGSECTACDVGSYADASGASACTSCGAGRHFPALWATMQGVSVGGATQWVPFTGASNASQCGCSQGAFLLGSECVACGTGMSCAGDNQAVILPGYFSSATSPADVFQCFGASLRCSGGIPGTCAPGRDNSSVACSACQAGMYAVADGSCAVCGKADWLPAISTAIVVLILLICAYYQAVSEDHSRKISWTSVLSMIVGQVVGMTQQLSLLSRIQLSWPEPLMTALSISKIIQFDPEIVRIGCVAPASPTLRFAFMVFGFLVLTAVLVVIHLVARFFSVVLPNRRPIKTRMLIAASGMLVLAFFLTVTSNMLQPFRCDQSPNNAFTVQAYPGVICGSKQHWELIGIGIVGAIFPISTIALSAWVIMYKIPQTLRTGRFGGVLRTFGFLFSRFRTGSYHYATVLLVRNMLLAVYPVIPDAGLSIILTIATFAVSMVLTVQMEPWRLGLMNWLDGLTSFLMILVFAASGLLLDKKPSLMSLVVLCGIFVVSLLILGVGNLLWTFGVRVLLKRKPFTFFLSHQKAAAGSLCRLLKMKLEESQGVKAFLDSDDLVDASKLFDYVGLDTETFVILATPDILARKWCIGEFVNARLNKVHSVLVPFPGFQIPDEDYIGTYAKRVPDITDLVPYGISLEVVNETLRWLGTLPIVAFPSKLTGEPMLAFVNALHRARPTHRGSLAVLRSRSLSFAPSFTKSISFEGSSGSSTPEASAVVSPAQSQSPTSSKSRGSWGLGSRSKRGTPRSSDSASSVSILVDHTNMEAAATAYIVADLLRPMLMHIPGMYPTVLGAQEELPASTETLILIFSTDCLGNQQFARQLTAAAERSLQRLLVLSEDTFRFPEAKALEQIEIDLVKCFEGVVETPMTSAEVCVEAVKSAFEDIAICVNPGALSATADVLNAKVRQIADRLLDQRLLKTFKKTTSFAI